MGARTGSLFRNAERVMGCLRSVVPIKREAWERFGLLRGLYGFAVFVVSLVTIARWWFWWDNEIKLYVPVLWTLMTVALVASGPAGRRRIVVLGVLGLYMFYGVKGLLLGHIPQALLLIAAAGIAFALVALTSPPGYYD